MFGDDSNRLRNVGIYVKFSVDYGQRTRKNPC